MEERNMSKVMKATDFVNTARDIANNYKTLYVMGCFGAPLNSTNRKRYANNCDYNRQAKRTAMINAATSDTFGFDCVCLIKGILWGWNGNKNKTYGGATYASNGVADVNADTMITSTYCYDISTDFTNIQLGEVVWMKGHIGIYGGNGEIIEASPAWKNKVQITKITSRKWLKHAKLKYIDYATSTPVVEKPAAITPAKKGTITVASGSWNIRKGPGMNYAVVKVVKGGTKLDYFEIQNGWYKVADGYLGPKGVKGTSSTQTVSYYQKCASSHKSIVDALKSINVNSTYSYRAKIAKANGITAYIGLPSQNTKMLDLLKQGKLKKI